jgi:hypothetical protein
MAWGTRRHSDRADKESNPYVSKRGAYWVITQKDTGKVLSYHTTRYKAEASFRAMEAAKHGG